MMALNDVLRKARMKEDADFLRDGAKVLAQALMEQHDEWAVAKRYFSLESMAKLHGPGAPLEAAALAAG